MLCVFTTSTNLIFHVFSEKYTRFCQWKNLELNIQVSKSWYECNSCNLLDFDLIICIRHPLVYPYCISFFNLAFCCHFFFLPSIKMSLLQYTRIIFLETDCNIFQEYIFNATYLSHIAKDKRNSKQK